MSTEPDDAAPALGTIVDEGRGALPYELIHGESLVACAAWALGESGVDLVDATVPWEAYVEAGRDLVLHDALCPMTPPAFIGSCLELARSTGHAVIGVRPVTDTVKVVVGGRIRETLDREELVAVASPLVIPGSIVSGLGEHPSPDFARAVADLAAAGHLVERLAAPAVGRRVSSVEDVRVLVALTTATG